MAFPRDVKHSEIVAGVDEVATVCQCAEKLRILPLKVSILEIWIQSAM